MPRRAPLASAVWLGLDSGYGLPLRTTVDHPPHTEARILGLSRLARPRQWLPIAPEDNCGPSTPHRSSHPSLSRLVWLALTAAADIAPEKELGPSIPGRDMHPCHKLLLLRASAVAASNLCPRVWPPGVCSRISGAERYRGRHGFCDFDASVLDRPSREAHRAWSRFGAYIVERSRLLPSTSGREVEGSKRGVYQHCSRMHLHRYLAGSISAIRSLYVALGVNDGQRVANAVEGVGVKRLTYPTTDRKMPKHGT